MNWQQRIHSDPDVCHGKACITGTRIMVSTVLDNLAAGRTVEQVRFDYPTLKREDIHAVHAYTASLAHERNV